jgi:hypothetical protein
MAILVIELQVWRYKIQETFLRKSDFESWNFHHLGLIPFLRIHTKSSLNILPHLAWADSKMKVKCIAHSTLYSAFLSVEPTDFKNVTVENIHWALSLYWQSFLLKFHRKQKRQKFYYEVIKTRSILKFWPLRPRKWPLNLSSLKGCPVYLI